ncbi:MULTISPECIES: hypothetical protein [unclassified Agrococcus]|uniref:hypothetical protein n=1 Tax=unclassified Agrococcus TaxID=2615065 RepID=UPI0036064FBB
MTSTTLAQHPRTQPIAVHEHGWTTESTHATSEGTVRYVRCAACGARRVDLEPAASAPPAAASTIVAHRR